MLVKRPRPELPVLAAIVVVTACVDTGPTTTEPAWGSS